MGALSAWQDRQVLVTGATGLIGSCLTKHLLEQGARVVALVKDVDPRSELVRSGALEAVTRVYGVLEDYELLESTIGERDVDSVFHLGAQTLVAAALRSPRATLETNVRGTYNVLEACRVHGDLVQRVVVASSDKAYGSQATLPYLEDMRLEGRSPYDVSKSCADMLAVAYHASYGLPVAIARCGNVFGEGDVNWSRIVPGTTRSFLRGTRPVIRSDGSFVRDYSYVEDIASAYLMLAERADAEGVGGEAFNFGTETPMTVLEVVQVLQRLMDCGSLDPIILDTARPEIREQYLCTEKARTILGWTPSYDLTEGLRRTIDWYRACLA